MHRNDPSVQDATDKDILSLVIFNSINDSAVRIDDAGYPGIAATNDEYPVFHRTENADGRQLIGRRGLSEVAFVGDIDEVNVLNYAWSDTEVAQHYAQMLLETDVKTQVQNS